MNTQRKQPQQSPMSPLETLVEGLTKAELNEFVSAIQYLDERMTNNQGQSPEGNIANILNKLSPNVRERFMLLSNVMETPRVAPFTPKMTEADHANAFGLDPEKALSAKAAMDGLEVNQRLIDRLGGADKPSQSPPSLRDLIAAATDKHTQGVT